MKTQMRVFLQISPDLTDAGVTDEQSVVVLLSLRFLTRKAVLVLHRR